MTAVTLNKEVQAPYPGMQVVDITAENGYTFATKFKNIDAVVVGMKSTSGTAGDLKFDYLTTAGTITVTTGGTATRLCLLIFGH